MMLFDVPRCSRICTATSRELKPGEVYYSLLVEEKENIKRLDYSHEAWPGPKELSSEVIGYWKSKIPSPNEKKVKLAPNEILLNFFEQLQDQPEKREMRYVLVLLLIRRRLFRLEKEETDTSTGQHSMVVYCPKRDASYATVVAVPDDERIEELQNTLADLLYS